MDIENAAEPAEASRSALGPSEGAAIWPPPPNLPAPRTPVAFPIRPHHLVLLVLLSFITLSAYTYYWAWRQARAINQVARSQPAAPWLMVATGVTAIVVRGWRIYDASSYAHVSWIGLMHLILYFWSMHNLRLGVMRAFGLNQYSEGYLSRAWSMVFGMFYIQMKINLNLRLRREALKGTTP